MRCALIAIFLLLPLTASAQNEAGSGPPDTLRRLDNLEQRLSKIEGAPAKTSISAFNPALGLALDLAYAHGPNDKSGFLFRAAELNVEAPIDPFLKGWAIFTGSSGGVDAEEAALQTTAENLTASRSRIQDTDFALETAALTRNQILQQAGTAMLAQANQLPNNVLTLLR